jgi:phosphohistidine phosphatase
MQLYLVRHAEAESGGPGHLRRLTAQGREQARALGARLREDGVRPDAILTSPVLRARETGELIGAELGIEPISAEGLAPGASPESVTDAIAGHGEIVVAVGHQPDCSRVAAALKGGPEPKFPPAGAARIEL